MNRLGTAQLCAPARKGTRCRAAARAQRGVTLIEALITLLVVSVGLLGIAALQVLGVQEGAAAFRHSQAIWLAYEMADRIRANANPAALDPNDLSAGPAEVADHYDGVQVSEGTPATGQSCGVGTTCSLQQMAAFDSDQWRLRIMDLPDGLGTIDEDAGVGGRYRIRVMWNEARAGTSGEEVGCPSDQTISRTCVELWVQP